MNLGFLDFVGELRRYGIQIRCRGTSLQYRADRRRQLCPLDMLYSLFWRSHDIHAEISGNGQFYRESPDPDGWHSVSPERWHRELIERGIGCLATLINSELGRRNASHAGRQTGASGASCKS